MSRTQARDKRVVAARADQGSRPAREYKSLPSSLEEFCCQQILSERKLTRYEPTMLWECVINIRDTFFIESVRDRVDLPHLSVVDIGGDHRQRRHDWGFENFNGGFSASRALSALQIWRRYTSIKRDRAWCGLLDAHRIGWPCAFQDSLIFVAVATWSWAPSGPARIVLLIGGAIILILNTGAIMAMLKHYHEDRDFMYGLDIKFLDDARAQKGR